MAKAYIEREAALNIVKHNWRDFSNANDAIQQSIDDFKRIPAADVREVVHARWLDGYRRQLCPICCYKGMRSWRFCPQCGAMMDGEG